MFINRMDKEAYSNNKIVHKNKKEYISDTFKNMNVRNSMSNENSQTKKKKKQHHMIPFVFKNTQN